MIDVSAASEVMAKRDDVSVKLDRLLVGMARIIADRRGIPLAQFLSELTAAPITRIYEAEIAEAAKEIAEAKVKRKGGKKP